VHPKRSDAHVPSPFALTTDPPASGRAPGDAPPVGALWVAAIGAAALFAAVGARAAFLRYFVNDDYQLLYTGWLRALGRVPGRDFGAQSFHVLPDLIAIGFRLAGAGLGVVWGARLAILLATIGAAVAAAIVARRVVSPAAAPFAFVYALFTWGVLVRGGDVRPDVISAALWLVIVALVARPLDARAARYAGAVFALALVVRFKSLVIAPALLTAVAVAAWRAPPPRFRTLASRAGAAALGVASVACAFGLYLWATGQTRAFVDANRAVVEIAAEATAGAARARHVTLSLVWGHDAWFCILAVIGVGVVATQATTRPVEATTAAVTTVLAATTLLVANPALYPYSLAALGPLLAPVAAAAPAALLASLSRRGASRVVQAALGLGLLLLPVARHGLLLGELVARRTNGHQLALQAWLERTPADTFVWALEGIGLFRPSLHDWRLAQVSLPLYRRGEIDLGAQLDDSRPEVFVTNYRVPAWLAPDDAARVLARSVAIAPDLRVLGAVARPGAPSTLTTRRARTFRVFGACMVDHAPRRDETVFLPPGLHDIDGACALLLDVPPTPRELLEPTLPFLIPPDADVYENP
jgi:hypothetical protein